MTTQSIFSSIQQNATKSCERIETHRIQFTNMSVFVSSLSFELWCLSFGYTKLCYMKSQK